MSGSRGGGRWEALGKALVPVLGVGVAAIAAAVAHEGAGEVFAGASFPLESWLPESRIADELAARETSARIAWGVSMGTLLWASALGALYAAVCIARSLRGGAKAGLAAVGFLVATVLVTDLMAPHLFGGDLREHLLVRVADDVDRLLATGTIFAYASAALLLAATSAVLHRALRETGDLQHLARTNRSLRVLLYIGAAVVATATVQVAMLYRWGIAWRDPAFEGAESFERLAAVIGAAAGVFGTALLCSCFIPAFVIHSEKVQELARATLPQAGPEELQQTLERAGLAGGLRETVQTTFALLVPAIAGGGFGEVLRALQ